MFGLLKHIVLKGEGLPGGGSGSSGGSGGSLGFNVSVNAKMRYNHLPRYRRDAKQMLMNVMREAAFDVEAQAKRNIVSHDLIDTGALLNSAFVTENDDSVRIGFSQHYAIWHEVGTRHHVARPFLVPAFDAVRAEIPKRITQAFGQRSIS